MKVKFITLFTPLIVASLGFAHPASFNGTTAVPSSNKTSLTASEAPQGIPPQLASLPPQELSAFEAAAANSPLGDLSQKCQSTLLSIITSPEFLKCVPIQSLLPLLPLVTDPTLLKNFFESPSKKTYPPVEKPLVQFATLFCPAPKCSDNGVAGAVKAIADGCKEDLDKKNPLIVMIFDLVVFYSPLHDSVCFQNGKTFCFDESINTVLDLAPSKFPITKNPLVDSVAVADPQKICTKCNEQIINTILNFLNKNVKDPSVLAVLQSFGITNLPDLIGKVTLGGAVKCGQDYVSGNVPK